MNDRHPSGTPTAPAAASEAASAHYASYGTQEAQYGDLTTYDGYDTAGFATASTATSVATETLSSAAFAPESFAADPLFGSLPAQGTGAYDTTSYAATDPYAPAGGYDTTGTYDTTQWSGAPQSPDTGSHQTLNYDSYAAQHHATYDTGAYDTTTWADAYQPLPTVPPQAGGPESSGQWDTSAWLQPDTTDQPDQHGHDGNTGHDHSHTGHGGHPGHGGDSEHHEPRADLHDQQDRTGEQPQHHPWDWGTRPYDSGAFDATQWNSDGTAPQDDGTPRQDDGLTATGELPAVPTLLEGQEETAPSQDVTPPPASRAAARAASRGRRRPPAKRSALLTIAVPSACVMGVAGIAAASVDGLSGDDGGETTASAADTAPQVVKPSTANNKLDTQLASLSAGADDFADRASRTQERIDLRAEQEAERRRAAEEAARKERLRPKFALPVDQHGLSAYYGQSGINWMSVHSGIDFPVSYGTTVRAVTDGTVRTQLNSAYGNMLILTAKDGTETWYCHLSSYQVPSGTTVKAGDPIAYSGNTGNSTGPHLHFEVRPSGGAAIDPLAWLRSHGLDPT
ncbi:M23 family metallopeptidase [Streptomyces griseoviridis]|uniref:Peptidase n=1 Tax=Streptomyces griseoviridis TaxID=45398 RepID=A0A918G852_STRGD|nr:M23 family metallopeptidase [Streptomyces niveoruber]GGS24351.1 peptidase [Streptomyces niveoruber]